MPNFEYRVTDASGQEYAGVLEAGSPQELEENLKSQGYTVQSVSAEGGAAGGGAAAAPTRKGGGSAAARRQKGKSKVAAKKGKEVGS